MISALSVLGFMIDGGTDDFDFTCGEVPLIIGHIVQGVPETEFHVGIQLEVLHLAGLVFQFQAVDFAGVRERNEIEQIRVQSVFGGQEPGIADSVMALIGIKFCLRRLPAGIPDSAGITDIVVLAGGIIGDAVIAVARDAEHLRVLVEAVAAACIGYDRKEIITAQIVDPRERGSGCEGVHHCIFESDGQLVVLVPQNDIATVIESLKRCYDKVIPKDMADRYPGMWDGFVLVGSLVSDAPLLLECGVFVPSLEKQIVDALSGGPTVRFTLQKFMEIYPVNYNRMRRYASRRGLSEELSSFLTNLDTERIDMFSKLQRYMAGTAIVKAWVFGSFARGEEKKDSDLDILVDYDPSANLSLLGAIRYKLDMEKLIGREVDLVENGYLKPFAIPSCERDKYLIYER